MNMKIRNIVKLIVLIFVIMFVYFVSFVNTDKQIQIVGLIIAGLVLIIIGYIYYIENKKMEYIREHSNIKRIILIGSEGKPDKQWSMEGVNSLLIGKNIDGNVVDIDLSDETYADYVSDKHAVLNFADGIWYIEDYSSKNGVGLKKVGEDYTLKLKPNVLYRLDKGDVIYISKIRLHIR